MIQSADWPWRCPRHIRAEIQELGESRHPTVPSRYLLTSHMIVYVSDAHPAGSRVHPNHHVRLDLGLRRPSIQHPHFRNMHLDKTSTGASNDKPAPPLRPNWI